MQSLHSGKLLLNRQKPSMIPPWVAARSHIRGKTEKPRRVSMRNDSTSTWVEIGHSEAQVLKWIWCTRTIWKSWNSVVQCSYRREVTAVSPH